MAIYWHNKKDMQMLGWRLQLYAVVLVFGLVWCSNKDSTGGNMAIDEALRNIFEVDDLANMSNDAQQWLNDNMITCINGAYVINAPNASLNISLDLWNSDATYLSAFMSVSKVTASSVKLVGPLLKIYYINKLMVCLLMIIDVDDIYFNITNPLGINISPISISVPNSAQRYLRNKKPVRLMVVGDHFGLCALLSRIYYYAPLKALHIITKDGDICWPWPIQWSDCYTITLTADHICAALLNTWINPYSTNVCQTLTLQRYSTQDLQGSPYEIYDLMDEATGRLLFCIRRNLISTLIVEDQTFIYMCLMLPPSFVVKSNLTLIIVRSTTQIDIIKNQCIMAVIADLGEHCPMFTCCQLENRLNNICFEVKEAQLIIGLTVCDSELALDPNTSSSSDCNSNNIEDWVSLLVHVPGLLNIPVWEQPKQHLDIKSCPIYHLYTSLVFQWPAGDIKPLFQHNILKATYPHGMSDKPELKYQLNILCPVFSRCVDDCNEPINIFTTAISMIEEMIAGMVTQRVLISYADSCLFDNLGSLFCFLGNLTNNAEIIFDSITVVMPAVKSSNVIKARVVYFKNCGGDFILSFLSTCALLIKDVSIYISGDYDSWSKPLEMNLAMWKDSRRTARIFYDLYGYIKSDAFWSGCQDTMLMPINLYSSSNTLVLSPSELIHLLCLFADINSACSYNDNSCNLISVFGVIALFLNNLALSPDPNIFQYVEEYNSTVATEPTSGLFWPFNFCSVSLYRHHPTVTDHDLEALLAAVHTGKYDQDLITRLFLEYSGNLIISWLKGSFKQLKRIRCRGILTDNVELNDWIGCRSSYTYLSSIKSNDISDLLCFGPTHDALPSMSTVLLTIDGQIVDILGFKILDTPNSRFCVDILNYGFSPNTTLYGDQSPLSTDLFCLSQELLEELLKEFVVSSGNPTCQGERTVLPQITMIDKSSAVMYCSLCARSCSSTQSFPKTSPIGPISVLILNCAVALCPRCIFNFDYGSYNLYARPITRFDVFQPNQSEGPTLTRDYFSLKDILLQAYSQLSDADQETLFKVELNPTLTQH
ncbi:hypothetical protein NEHOM01_2272 [Nematocida homosporus]|uniref:uncharacterized protein n=1 Tax=Nematocida homosporus TaxID=1912981 RepID=UPI002220D831|nr:uncharacterized protein NEHOM01_2272 [Nematocida homosporus]KAI5187564.1 hypothetical protein NEHOM01_2272 [Nematocida homosporus]